MSRFCELVVWIFSIKFQISLCSDFCRS